MSGVLQMGPGGAPQMVTHTGDAHPLHSYMVETGAGVMLVYAASIGEAQRAALLSGLAQGMVMGVEVVPSEVALMTLRDPGAAVVMTGGQKIGLQDRAMLANGVRQSLAAQPAGLTL